MPGMRRWLGCLPTAQTQPLASHPGIPEPPVPVSAAPALCPRSHVAGPRPPPGPARPRFAVHGVEGAEPQQRLGGARVSPGGDTRGTPGLFLP